MNKVTTPLLALALLMLAGTLEAFAQNRGAESVAPSATFEPRPVQLFEVHTKNKSPLYATASVVDDKPYASAPVTPSVSRPFRDLPTLNLAARAAQEVKETPRGRRSGVVPVPDRGNATVDPLLAGAARASLASTPDPLVSFDGISFTGALPPDPVMDVGPNHIVQAVNVVYAVYNKTGTLLAGPTDINELWNGAGGSCEAQNAGDPIVLYDQLADRWVISQFSSANDICLAVSTTSDPLGTYFRYEFTMPSFPDYFKLGVWTDAYYMGANENTYSQVAFDRTKILAGQAATFVRFDGQDNFTMPADLNGTALPPAGTPGLFYTFLDNSFHGGSDRLELYAFDVDFTTPTNSTLTLLASLPVASYTYTVCGFFVLNCIDQPSTTRGLDPVSEWPMFRLNYRNMGTHEAMVANFTIDAGSDRAGIRWYELRKTGAGAWTIFQEGTHAPGTENRWMGSIAMDGAGNIGLGYSITSTTLFPGLRYTVRTPNDPINTFQTEAILQNGGGSQTSTSSRWGDYSLLTVDPVDDATFWFTGEYQQVTASSNWRTRIGSFQAEDGPPPAEFITVTAPNGGETWNVNTVQNITWSDNIAGNIKIELFKAGVLNTTLAASEPSDGTFSWSVPAGQATGSDYTVRITSLDNASLTDESDANFTIQAGTNTFVTVTFPNGGESFARGSVVNIAWNDDLTGNVSIRLIRGTSVVRVISNNTASDGAFSWTVPNNQAIASDYKVRITSRDNTAIRDESDAFFSITSASPASKGSAVSSQVPAVAVLEPNYPNPFNPATTLRYQLSEGGLVRLKVYNLLGQEVASLVGGYREAGVHEVYFDASHLSAGVYLYTLEAGGVVQTQRMTLLK